MADTKYENITVDGRTAAERIIDGEEHFEMSERQMTDGANVREGAFHTEVVAKLFLDKENERVLAANLNLTPATLNEIKDRGLRALAYGGRSRKTNAA